MRAYNQLSCGNRPVRSIRLGRGRRGSARLASAMLRGAVGLLLLLLSAGMLRAEWPFPTAPGTLWQYALTREPGSDTVSITRRVLSPQQIDEQSVIPLETAADGVLQSTELLKRDGEAVLATSRSSAGKLTSFDPAVTVVPGKFEIGSPCDGDGEIAALTVVMPLKVIGEEEVRVPAGSFRAWRIHGEIRGTISTVADRWFVRGIGSVKESVTERSPTGELLARNTLELISLPTANSSESAAPGPKKLLEASVSTSTDGDPLTTISADALQIVARWRVHDVANKTKIRAVWTAEDTGEVAPPDYKVDEATSMTTDPNAFGTFTLSRPEDGWAAGKYRVEFYVGNILAETVKLTIASTTPAPED